MSLQACADIVAKSDPDRFAAAMAAPVKARRVLFPIYAFNVEVTRAPWVASEPMIGEMRLQWWRDVLDEIGQGGSVRKHEVATPLADVLDPVGAQALDRLVQARRWDLYKDPFEDEAHLLDYLEQTGAVMWAAASALGAQGATTEEIIRKFGQASAFVRFMAAVPELEAKGRVPLLDGRDAGVAMLAERIWELRPTKQAIKREVPSSVLPVLLEGWQTPSLLARIQANPGVVRDRALKLSEFRKRVLLLRASVFGVF